MGEGANQAEQQTQIETTPETVDALLEVTLLNTQFSIFFKETVFLAHCSHFSFFFFQAARYDDIEDIARLESSGVSLDSKDSLGRTGYHSFVYLLFRLF